MQDFPVEYMRTILYSAKGGKFNIQATKREWYIKHEVGPLYDQIVLATHFLNPFPDTSFRERVYYIENTLHSPQLCKYCNLEKLAYISHNQKLRLRCKSSECRSKHSTEIMTQQWKQMPQELKDKRTAASTNSRRGVPRSEKAKESYRQAATGRKQSKETAQRRVESRHNNGRPWHTESTIAKMSQTQKRICNTEERKEQQRVANILSRDRRSSAVKSRILRGEFTPCITNSWTRWKAFINLAEGETRKVRSNWEAVFWILNPDLLYEKIRIPYMFDGKEYIYIIDFADERNRKLYEIKPKATQDLPRNKAKEAYAREWCRENGYTYEIISNGWFVNHADKVNYLEQPQLEKSMKQFLHG